MKVRVIYDPILRKVTEKVTVFDDELKREASEMVKTLREHDAVGLAANQVGIDRQLCVIEYRPHKDEKAKSIQLLTLCNPKIIKATPETEVSEEGCLSVPALELPTKRNLGVTVEAQDIEGRPVKIKAKGLLARALQHEVDHLNGRLFTDIANEADELRNYAFAKIVFLGSDDFSLKIFQSLLENGLNVMAVITETDKKAGRGQQLKSPVIKTAATEAGVAIFQPQDTNELAEIISQLQPDLIVLASYGKILPSEVLAVPIFGSINVHPSLLPNYRGATPIQSVILNGETETGVTLMQMNAGVDTGAVFAARREQIGVDETYSTLKAKLAELGAKLLLESVPKYLSGRATLTIQDDSQATKTRKLSKEMGEIDWSRPLSEIDRQIRALNPWPGTFTYLDGKLLKVLEASFQGDELRFQTVQLEGKNPADWADFVRGYKEQLKKADWYAKIT